MRLHFCRACHHYTHIYRRELNVISVVRSVLSARGVSNAPSGNRVCAEPHNVHRGRSMSSGTQPTVDFHGRRRPEQFANATAAEEVNRVRRELVAAARAHEIEAIQSACDRLFDLGALVIDDLNRLVVALIAHGDIDGAKQCIADAEPHYACAPNKRTFLPLFVAFIRAEDGFNAEKVVHNMVLSGCEVDVRMMNSLIRMYGLSQRSRQAVHCFRWLLALHLTPDADTFSTLLMTFGHARAAAQARECWEQMHRLGFAASVADYTSMIMALMHGRAAEARDCVRLLNEVEALVDTSNDTDVRRLDMMRAMTLAAAARVHAHVDVLRMCQQRLARHASDEEPLDDFWLMRICNALLVTLATPKTEAACVHLFEAMEARAEMRASNFAAVRDSKRDEHRFLYMDTSGEVGFELTGVTLPPPNAMSVCSVLNVFAERGDVESAEALVERCARNYSIAPDTSILNLLLKTCVRVGDFDRAIQWLSLAQRSERDPLWSELTPDIRSYGTLVGALSALGAMNGAEHVVHLMSERDVQPDHVMYADLLLGYARINDFDAMHNVLTRVLEAGFVPRQIVYSLCIEEALRHRGVALAMRLLEEARDHQVHYVRPSTLLRVACCAASIGNVEVSEKILERLKRDHELFLLFERANGMTSVEEAAEHRHAFADWIRRVQRRMDAEVDSSSSVDLSWIRRMQQRMNAEADSSSAVDVSNESTASSASSATTNSTRDASRSAAPTDNDLNDSENYILMSSVNSSDHVWGTSDVVMAPTIENQDAAAVHATTLRVDERLGGDSPSDSRLSSPPSSSQLLSLEQYRSVSLVDMFESQATVAVVVSLIVRGAVHNAFVALERWRNEASVSARNMELRVAYELLVRSCIRTNDLVLADIVVMQMDRIIGQVPVSLWWRLAHKCDREGDVSATIKYMRRARKLLDMD